jgi:TorA maturation chaperone TorD
VLAAPPSIDAYTASYDLLARLYLDGPDALRPQRLPETGPLLDALGQVDSAWPARVGQLLSLHAPPADLERTQADYLHSFVLPVPGRYVPPYASVYLEDGVLWGESTFKIQRLYAIEGLSWQRAAEPRQGSGLTVTAPDHIGIEFAFLALATSRHRRGSAETKRQQRLTWFLGDHLDRWLPRYRDALIDALAGPVLEGWTAWAVELVHSDLGRRAPSPD